MSIQIDDDLRTYIEKGRDDPVAFINELLGMPLHEGQIKYLREAVKGIPGHDQLTRRFLLSCANRWGKTAVIACLQLWYLFYKFGVRVDDNTDWFTIEYRTANIAPESSLTQPVFFAMKQIMTSTYPVRRVDGKVGTNNCKIEWFYIEEKTINTPPYKMYFLFNSYIEHLSLMGGKGNNLQGKPYGLITYDEACRSDHLQLELDNSILGRLLDWTAPLHLLSTPDSDSASLVYYKQLYDEGLVGLNQSYTQTGDIHENTFMTETQINDQVRMLEGNPLKAQMLKGEFVWGSNTLFSGQAIIDAEDESLNDGVRYEDGHTYVVGIDTAIGSDEMVYTVIDNTSKPFRLVRQIAAKGNSKSPQLHLNDLLMLIDEYKRNNPDGTCNIEILLETFNGESVRFYHDLPPHIQDITTCFGSWKPDITSIKTDNPTKPVKNDVKKAEILINLKKLLESHELRIPKNENRLIQQLTIYKEDDKKLKTDRVIALCLACYWANELKQAVPTEWTAIEW